MRGSSSLGSPFKCRFGYTQFIAGNDGHAWIAFSNGSGRMLFVDFDALGMPVFSPRSAGAWVRIDVFVASMTVAQLSAVLAAEF